MKLKVKNIKKRDIWEAIHYFKKNVGYIYLHLLLGYLFKKLL